jgi:hypothetical protein
MKWKSVLLASAAGLLFSLGGAQSASADHRDDNRNDRNQRQCYDKIRKEQDKLERDIRKHGWNSRQAQQRRTKVQRLRSQCGGSFWGRDGRNGRDDGWFGRDRNRRNDDWRDNDRNRRDRDRQNRNRNNRNRDLEWWRNRR